MRVLDTIERACVLCGCHIQKGWASRVTNLHQILLYAWTFLLGSYSDDSEGRSSGQLAIGSFIAIISPLMYHFSCGVFGETSNHPDDSTPLQPRFGALWLLAFPKAKITFEREEITDYGWDSGEYDAAPVGNSNEALCSVLTRGKDSGRTVWGLKEPALKGTEASLSHVQCFLYLVSSSVNVSIFHRTWLDTFWTGLVCIS